MSTISVIIPTYNRSEVICKTLESVKQQTFQDFECIVVDDHSSDNTIEVLQSYCLNDSRFKFLVNSRMKGAQGARNTGLFVSSSEWIMFFDSDNSMHPELLATLLDAVDDSIDVCKCFSNVVDKTTGQIIGIQDWVAEGDIHRALFCGKSYVDYNQEIIRRKKLLEIGGLDENCPSLQEFETNIRLSKICSYHTVPCALLDYYVGGNDTISSNFEKQIKGKIYNLRKYKTAWLDDKKNADRFVYECLQKIKMLSSFTSKLKYLLKLFMTVPEMIPFYIKKKLL